jgi:hypothetical protein
MTDRPLWSERRGAKLDLTKEGFGALMEGALKKTKAQHLLDEAFGFREDTLVATRAKPLGDRIEVDSVWRADLQARLALARVGEQPPASTPTSLLVGTSTGTDAKPLLPGEARGPLTSTWFAGVSSESGWEARPPVLVQTSSQLEVGADFRFHGPCLLVA